MQMTEAGKTGSGSAAASFPVPPAISFHFDELKRELSSFSQVFTSWIANNRQALVEEKQAYLHTLSSEHDAVEELKKQHAQLLAKKQSVTKAMESEQKEFNEIQSVNTELCTQQATLSQRLEFLKSAVDAANAEADREMQLLNKRERQRDALTAKFQAELALFQEQLGLYIEGLPNNATRFTFVRIDQEDWDRRFFFVLDVSADRYSVRECEPAIPDLASLVNYVNESRDFYCFLKRMRHRFVECAKQKARV